MLVNVRNPVWWTALGLAVINLASAQAPSPVGIWETVSDTLGKPDSRVRIAEVAGELRGTVIQVYSPPNERPDPVCEKCEGALKNKPVVGMTILTGFRRTADGYGSGEILDPNDGKTYRCQIELQDGGRKLAVRGYVGIPLLGRTQVWTRLE
jgi:uncharacterized protein (DUF2147 family)